MSFTFSRNFKRSKKRLKNSVKKWDLKIKDTDFDGERFSLFCHNSDFDQDVLVTGYFGNTGKTEKVTYLNMGSELTSSDDLYMRFNVRSLKKLSKNFLAAYSDASFLITPQNIDSFAERMDAIPGMAKGDLSTYVSLGDDYYAFA